MTVMTRYTLRLLTSQQFQRAATLVCACELIHRDNEDRWGAVPSQSASGSGASNSPNNYPRRSNCWSRSRTRSGRRRFPARAVSLVRDRDHPGGDAPDGSLWGVHAANDSFHMACPNRSCDFHGFLPVSSVDEDLYDNLQRY